ncbi:membrane bound O-acyl transferase family-domain-containing protein [Thelonectria olida]|uniref:Membrane bound O-acyl transferase family-domain-containing protein n=1 Tax=Thelonectria olida TaxID=1576542 RepID=A0A9P8W205_9HYPO|nr:membrane bound O-acyl transferase family-domain-containing protein [Thelonectria olida]
MELIDKESSAASYVKCLSLLLGACIPSAVLIASTPKSGVQSFARFAWLLAIFSNGKQLFQEISATGTSLVINDLVIGYLAFVLLQCCNFLIVTRLDAQDLIQANIFQLSDGVFYKSFCAFCLIFNFRGIGTPWQVKRLNKFPRFYDRHSNNGNPTPSWFIMRQLMIVGWHYLFLDIVWISSLDTPAEDTERLFGPGKEFVYFNATVEQWAARVGVSLVSWLGPGRVTIDMAYRITSVVSVILGITSPEDWPPLFGSIWDAYTIRACWSTFWHQSFRWPLTSISNFVCRDLLRLPQPSAFARYVNVSIVFFVSGVVHLALDSFSPQPPPMGPALGFFSSFCIPILLEEVVQEACRRITGVDTNDRKQAVPLWHKLVGYLWVAFWLSLTSPWYLYPATRTPPEAKWLVPGSVVNSIGLIPANVLLIAGGLILKVAIGGEL